MSDSKKTKLIILSGTSNSGKTNTLKLLVSQIISFYKVDESQYESYIDYRVAKSWMNTTVQDMLNDNSDWLVKLFDIKSKSIVIHTAGDTGFQVSESLSYMGKFDVVICATKAIKHLETGSIGTMQAFLHSNNDLTYYPFYKLQYDSEIDDDKVFDDNRVSSLILSLLEKIV